MAGVAGEALSMEHSARLFEYARGGVSGDFGRLVEGFYSNAKAGKALEGFQGIRGYVTKLAAAGNGRFSIMLDIVTELGGVALVHTLRTGVFATDEAVARLRGDLMEEVKAWLRITELHEVGLVAAQDVTRVKTANTWALAKAPQKTGTPDEKRLANTQQQNVNQWLARLSTQCDALGNALESRMLVYFVMIDRGKPEKGKEQRHVYGANKREPHWFSKESRIEERSKSSVNSAFLMLRMAAETRGLPKDLVVYPNGHPYPLSRTDLPGVAFGADDGEWMQGDIGSTPQARRTACALMSRASTVVPEIKKCDFVEFAAALAGRNCWYQQAKPPSERLMLVAAFLGSFSFAWPPVLNENKDKLLAQNTSNRYHVEGSVRLQSDIARKVALLLSVGPSLERSLGMAFIERDPYLKDRTRLLWHKIMYVYLRFNGLELKAQGFVLPDDIPYEIKPVPEPEPEPEPHDQAGAQHGQGDDQGVSLKVETVGQVPVPAPIPAPAVQSLVHNTQVPTTVQVDGPDDLEDVKFG